MKLWVQLPLKVGIKNDKCGWAQGNGKRTYIYMPEKCEPELMYKMCDDIVFTIPELITVIRYGK